MNNIVLIGFMACGKTTIGNSLAKKTGYTLIDTDEEIVKNEGRSINDIFAQDGEPAFRAIETQTITNMQGNVNNCIISTGGGLPITAGNEKILARLGTVVYLTVTKETVLERIKGDNSRPLLAKDAQEKTSKLLEFRTPIYEKAAQIIVKTDGRSVEEIVDEIIEKLQGEK